MEIVHIPLSAIKPNPLRLLKDYPFIEAKLVALRQSIRDIGVLPRVIARKVGTHYEQAFNHHVIEAARQELGSKASVPVIVEDLTDKQMLQYMGRENLEDYNAEFLIMLEAWEAAAAFCSRQHAVAKPQAIDIAILLGWIRLIDDHRPGRKENRPALTHTAEACNATAKLIQGGYMTREELRDLSVKAAHEICARVIVQHEQLEKMAAKTGRPPKEVEKAKKRSAKAGIIVAEDVRQGRVAQRDIRGSVDLEAFRTKGKDKQSPLFAMFGKSLAESISRLGQSDTIGERLQEVRKALGEITMQEDFETVKRLSLECDNAAIRFGQWRTALDNPKAKIVPLKAIEQGG
jgi:hypothetical protein